MLIDKIFNASMTVNAWDGVKKMEPDSSQWWPVNGQETTSTKWNTWFKHKKTLLLWRWSNTRTGFLERLWSLYPWRYQNLTGHSSAQPPVTDPALSMWAGLDNLQASLPILNMLWFCNFKIIQKVCNSLTSAMFERTVWANSVSERSKSVWS